MIRINALVVFAFVLEGLIYSQGGLSYFFLVNAFCVCVFFLYRRWLEQEEERKKVKWYAERLHNIYEVSHFPRDKEVTKRANEHRAYLEKTGNPYNVSVVEIIYGDIDTGGHPLEDFEAEFPERVKKVKYQDSLKRNEYLRKVLKIDNLPNEYQKKAQNLPKAEIEKIERDFYKRNVLLQEF